MRLNEIFPRPVVTAAAVAACISLGVPLFVLKFVEPLPRTMNVVGGAAVSVKATQRAAEQQWPEMRQAEINKLTAALKVVPPEKRKPVVIFCKSDALCGDLALNIENAFESAHWTVTRDEPLIDDTRGVGVGDPALAEIFRRTTTLRLASIWSSVEGAISISIGKRAP